jgi:hypothetical protein
MKTSNLFYPIPEIKKWFLNKSHWILVAGLLLFVTVAFLLHWNDKSSMSIAAPAQPPVSLDTVIPRGFVLVPIDLANAESLSSMIGDFAIVDLYRSNIREFGHSGSFGQRVGHQLRLLRAPLNPKMFAVLVPDGEAKNLVGNGGPLLAVLQNNHQSGMGNIEKLSKKVQNIEYYSAENE